MLAPEIFYAQAIITIVRGRADQARREGRNEFGASAIEWAIISALVVGLALTVFAVVRNVVEDNAGKIERGTGTP